MTERVTEQTLGVPRSYASFAVPLGATTKMDGCAAIYPALAAIFVAQFFDVPLSLTDYLLIVVVSVIGSAATAGVTGAVVMLTLTLSTLGLPLAGVGLLLAIDPILDMGRTAVNVAGQALVPTIVAKREGILDEERYRTGAPADPLRTRERGTAWTPTCAPASPPRCSPPPDRARSPRGPGPSRPRSVAEVGAAGLVRQQRPEADRPDGAVGGAPRGQLVRRPGRRDDRRGLVAGRDHTGQVAHHRLPGERRARPGHGGALADGGVGLRRPRPGERGHRGRLVGTPGRPGSRAGRSARRAGRPVPRARPAAPR